MMLGGQKSVQTGPAAAREGQEVTVLLRLWRLFTHADRLARCERGPGAQQLCLGGSKKASLCDFTVSF